MAKLKLKPNFGLSGIILAVVCAALVAADLVTKYLEEKFGWNLPIIKGWVEIKSGSRNPGCAFSFLDQNPQIGQPILITLTIIMLAALIVAFICLPPRFKILKTAVTLVAAGAIGNLADRFMFREVRDFIGLNMLFNGSLVYCNFADFCIVIGAILAIVDLLFLNEWALIPLTKRAKEAQAAQKLQNEGTDGGDENG